MLLVPQISYEEFKGVYEMLDILDRGTFSLVRKAVVRSTNELVAVKIVDTSNFPGAEGVVQRELEALMVVQHPNCIQMRAYCRNSNYVYIVVNLARGEVLVDWLQEKRQCTELETAIIVHGILQGVFYLHSNNIVHRDLKLDNLMFESPGDINSLKILDFGFSKVLQGTGDILQTICGSPQYVAPEILNMTSSGTNQPIPYTHAVDAWSIGVIMYMLIAGYAPFDEDNEMKMYHKIIQGEFSFHSAPWDNVSNQAKELICGLLNVDPMRRMTVPQAIASPFIAKFAQHYKQH
ncbi:serine/threonine protein kinase [Chloropicon primus]|uniref:Serine/threonine protein kinase n=1 Tax=Chloropicon primus TaxID=1764295 RepID=A0A5B8MUZ4_9CHLO|nr:serine/threonine protein kinase [Chloropicon primus]UPR03826.1 serine/threonine protein kinase [Chloropicon primus]|eukprot:QDZ24618.1 serine/threonine protein kinase [Chloropicon primus]